MHVTPNASDEMRYKVIKSVHIRVKLLYDRGGTSDRDVTKGLLTPIVDDSEKVSIGEIRKDDLAFRMNAASRKVLRKVLSGFIITEPYMRRCKLEEELDAPE